MSTSPSCTSIVIYLKAVVYLVSPVGTLFRRSTYLLVIATFMLMLMGGYVKAIGAGLSCPDWPLCYGKLFPFLGEVNIDPYTQWQVFAEWFHRLWAALTGFLLIGIVIQAKSYRDQTPLLFSLGVICIVLFGVQVILGGLTVIGLLNEFIVVAHLATAILIIMLEMTIAFVTFIYSGGLTGMGSTSE